MSRKRRLEWDRINSFKRPNHAYIYVFMYSITDESGTILFNKPIPFLQLHNTRDKNASASNFAGKIEKTRHLIR